MWLNISDKLRQATSCNARLNHVKQTYFESNLIKAGHDIVEFGNVKNMDVLEEIQFIATSRNNRDGKHRGELLVSPVRESFAVHKRQSSGHISAYTHSPFLVERPGTGGFSFQGGGPLNSIPCCTVRK